MQKTGEEEEEEEQMMGYIGLQDQSPLVTPGSISGI